jgi:hypothetical protein
MTEVDERLPVFSQRLAPLDAERAERHSLASSGSSERRSSTLTKRPQSSPSADVLATSLPPHRRAPEGQRSPSRHIP